MSNLTTTPKCYPAPSIGERYELGLVGLLLKNDRMSADGAAAAACASRPTTAIPKPPLRAREILCTKPSHHDGHNERNEIYSVSRSGSGNYAGQEL